MFEPYSEPMERDYDGGFRPEERYSMKEAIELFGPIFYIESKTGFDAYTGEVTWMRYFIHIGHNYVPTRTVEMIGSGRPIGLEKRWKGERLDVAPGTSIMDLCRQVENLFSPPENKELE